MNKFSTSLFPSSSTTVSPSELQTAKTLRRSAAEALQKNDIQKAHSLLCKAKSLKLPLKSIDYLRGLTFIKTGDLASAREALREELRYFPDNLAAQELLTEIDSIIGTSNIDNEEFRELYTIIRPYTMIGIPRLMSLFVNVKEICTNGPAGSFVECGVAGGGSSGLISAVINKYAPSRRLFSCDSYNGMPPASEFDIHDGQHAEDSGWGTGTCAAPESSVLNLCTQLGTRSIITTVKGYFEDTLPIWKERFGPIAFLHMDGDWYASTKAILENLYDKLVPGAYIQVDDFGHWDGCRKAITEFFLNRKIDINAYSIDQGGIWFKKQ